MKSLLGKVGVILIGLAILACAEVREANWKEFGESDNRFFYYDAKSITRPSKDVVRVWEKSVYNVKGITKMVEEYGKKYENISYSLCLAEFHCAEKKMNVLSIAHYSRSGGILSSTSYTEAEWDFIPTESIGETLYEILCK